MDSDLSLLEIAGEDDSLLLIPKDDSGVSNTSGIFSCSPLHCLRSLPPHAPQSEARVGAVGFEKLSSSHQDDINKENINGNKSEAPKLNVEPQQMKRKKKGAAYNLRKSMAWDRAFFTEEGVLNPLELSMISGNLSRTNNELTVIHEDEENTLVGEADIVDAYPVLQKIEEDLFKQLPEDRKIGALLSPKSDTLTKDTSDSTSLAKRKVLAVNDVDRNRSKRNVCPRPIASSSPDTAKAQSKESKVSKLPVSKTQVPVITSTAKSGASSASYSKRNQNAHSAVNVQRNVGQKGLSKILRSVQTNAKYDVADKCSIIGSLTGKAGKDINNPISKTHPTPRLQHQPIAEANKGFKVPPLHACNTVEKKQLTQFQTSKLSGLQMPLPSPSLGFEVHPPLRACNTGEKKQPRQVQAAKPSGLRMPSPSMGFFSQQKSSSSHSLLHKNKSSKSCKPAESNIPKPNKVVANSANEAGVPKISSDSNDIIQPIQEAVNQQLQYIHDLDERCGGQSETLNPSIVGEISLKRDGESHANGCLVHVTTLSSKESREKHLQEIIRACGSETEVAEIEDHQHPRDVQSGIVHRRLDNNGYDQVNDSKLMQDRAKANSQFDGMCEDYITDSTTACSTEVNDVSLERRNFYGNNIEHKNSTSQLCQMEQANCGSRGNEMSVSNDCNFSELQFRDDSSSRGTSLECDSLIAQHDVCGNFEKHARLLMSSKMNCMLCEDEIVVESHSHLHDESDSFEVSTNIDSDTRDFSKGGAESPSGLHEHKLLSQANRELDYARRVTENLHEKDAQVVSSDENLVKHSCNDIPSTSVTKDQFPVVVDSVKKESPLLELQRPILVADVDFLQYNVDGDLLLENNACSEEIRSENLFEGVSDQFNAYASENNTSNHYIQGASDIKDGNLNVDDRAECLQMAGAGGVADEIVEVELNHKVNAANVVSSIQRDEDQITNVVDWRCNKCDSISENLKLQVADNLASHERILQGSEASSSKRKSLSEEPENSASAKDDISNSQFDGMCEDYITDSTTACSTEVNDVSLERRNFYGNNIEHKNSTSQLCQMEQANCGSRGNEMSVSNDCNFSELQFRDDSSSRGTSLECDSLIAQHDVCGNFEKHARLLTSSKMNCMLCEDEIVVESHSHLHDESDSFEVSANIDSDTRDFSKGGAESPSGLHKHKLLSQATREPGYAKRVTENLHEKDAQVVSSDENLVKHSCNDIPSTSVTKDQFPVVKKESPLLELQRPILVADVDFQHYDVNGDLLLANNACSEDIRSENLFEGLSDQFNAYASEDNTSNHHIQGASDIKDGNLNVDDRAECLQMAGAGEVADEIVEVELNHKVNAANVVSSIQRNEDQITNVVDWRCNKRDSISENLKLQVADNLASHERILLGSEASSSKRKSLSEEPENSTSAKDDISNTNVPNQIAEDSNEIIHIQKSGSKRKLNPPTVVPPPNAAPFSDEWLAAMEAAGEDILTMKGGAVQNSPTDKPQHEPGPWSPVRRKNQAIGPYDCTKYTNMNIPSTSS